VPEGRAAGERLREREREHNVDDHDGRLVRVRRLDLSRVDDHDGLDLHDSR
jgi:hypothetical protein